MPQYNLKHFQTADFTAANEGQAKEVAQAVNQLLVALSAKDLVAASRKIGTMCKHPVKNLVIKQWIYS